MTSPATHYAPKGLALAIVLGIALAVTACAAILGIKDVTDDTPDAAMGGNGDSGGGSPDVSSGSDSRSPVDAGTCDANTTQDPNNCGACGHTCGTTNAMAQCVKGACTFVCIAGYAHCGDDSTGCATAPALDPHHCGMCDHDCLGASCAGGLCARTVLASMQNAPTTVAVDTDHVYWANEGSPGVMPINSDGAIQSVAKVDGGAPTPIATSQSAPWGIFLDGDQIYWTNRFAGEVRVAPKVGGASAAVATGQDQPWDVATDATNIYWSNSATDVAEPMQPAGSIWRLAKAGGMPVLLAGMQYHPLALALGGGYLFWPENSAPPKGTVRRVPVDGGVATLVAVTNACVSVASNGASLFWASSQPIDGGVVASAPLDGGNMSNLLTGLYNPAWVVADQSHVYWTDYTLGLVWRAGTDGSAPLLLAQGGKYSTGIAIDGQFVYWTDRGTFTPALGFNTKDGLVSRVAK